LTIWITDVYPNYKIDTPGKQHAALRPHDDWVQQAQFFDAGGQGFDIAQILSLAVADLDSGD
jgi:hypothetical protein